MAQQLFMRFCVLSIITIIVSALGTACRAEKTIMGHVENTTHDGVYWLFNMVFSKHGVWVLLGLAAFVVYLFWRKS